ncbi:MAG TPA: WbqC family protein [Flavobacteriales bacterium]|nr:WbqC family protein [Flavobacteriales bacterium]HPH81504.1 WbqC family protein [Flavobacteriales bacterium]
MIVSDQPILLQLNYTPLVDQMALIATGIPAQIESQENYQKQSFRNRCHVLTSQGVLPLVIPVLHNKGEAIRYTEAQTDSKNPWAVQHWRSLVSSYNKSAYFEYYKHHFEAIYLQPNQNLYAFNYSLLGIFCRIFQFELPNENKIWEVVPTDTTDLRSLFQPKKINSLVSSPYYQTFEMPEGFVANLSCYDLLFNLGPESLSYLKKRGIELQHQIG